MLRGIRDPVSTLTHLLGALLAAAGLPVLLVVGVRQGAALTTVSLSVYGVSLILLYVASTLYHWLRVSDGATRILRRLDHIMIFVLIAGTYTPFCLVSMRGAWGWSLLGVVWGLALAGGAIKMWWLHAPRWLSTSLYLGMGWLVLVAAPRLLAAMPLGGLGWLLAGGLLYSLGAIVYATRWPDPAPSVFGFHEVWHLFVLAGSGMHFWAVLRYVAHAG